MKYGTLREHVQSGYSAKELLKAWGSWASSALHEMDYQSPAWLLARQRALRKQILSNLNEDELILIDKVVSYTLDAYDRNLLLERYLMRLTYRDLGKKIGRSAATAMRFCDSAEQLFMAELKRLFAPSTTITKNQQ